MTITLHARALVMDLLRELGVRIDCGQLTLNINQGELASVDVHTHHRLKTLDRKTTEA